MKTIDQLWWYGTEKDWEIALHHYWNYVKPENLELERKMNHLSVDEIASLDKTEWYNFLKFKYFKWKYTAPNRYATTTRYLEKYIESGSLDKLYKIKEKLLSLNLSDIKGALLTAREIQGLGISGASGLISLMYPDYFGTVDQFMVYALRDVSELPEHHELVRINPDNITLENGILLINILRTKAQENNVTFNTDYWSPRKIDMILWSSRQK
jgi:hypothetical protein